MPAFAPAAISKLFSAIQKTVPKAIFSGIVGDSHHSFGYHLARADLPDDDYSVQLDLDLQGDASAASALDIGLPPDLMIAVTSRLIDAAKKKDPRLRALREFCGTTNGTNPHPFDLSTGTDDPNNTQGWDDSHLHHVHLSIHRAFAMDADALSPIADVIGALDTDVTEEDEMKIIKNKSKVAMPILVGAGPKPIVLGDQAKVKALGAAGVLSVAVADADYQTFRTWAEKK